MPYALDPAAQCLKALLLIFTSLVNTPSAIMNDDFTSHFLYSNR